MSEHLYPREPTTFDRSFSGLSSTVRAIASEAVLPRDRSFPASLCTTAGEVAATIDRGTNTATGTDADADTALTFDEHEGRADEILSSVAEAVALLEGYVRLRHDLLYSDRYADRERRDAAVLASDHLHAAAYATITDAPLPDRRSLELYRQLAAGSSALAAGFAAWTPTALAGGDETADAEAAARAQPSDGNFAQPRAVLTETAATLGATAVGAADDTRAAMDAYARSLSTALCRVTASASSPESGSADASTAGRAGDDPRETAARVLSGRSDASSSSDGASVTTPGIARHLERARDALAPLVDRSETAAADGTAGDDDGAENETGPTTPGPAPLTRLERATRIPFEDER
ncbi:hypothetical protein [Halopiger xanaduensis]|uniref:Polyprenyl synthetase n=1 Tax=Halopiger xanaduensis (strain DSM 18323 / JCM 14033 / SH-6) TaxID=797210 RepID=F8DA80_HALXS|nr:hypothetical protein [Halopiger xanaduensis]AEH38152.1 hypothetical protein Halxa_3541 [Halopiger xanaduensis SH-6]